MDSYVFQLQNEVLHAMVGRLGVVGHFEGHYSSGSGSIMPTTISPKI